MSGIQCYRFRISAGFPIQQQHGNDSFTLSVLPNASMEQTYTEDPLSGHPDYRCEYFDIKERALLHFTQPHKTIALCLGFLGIFINILCLAAVHFQMHGRFTPHFRFIVSLALSDILIAFSVVSHLINSVLNPTLPAGIGPRSLRLTSSCIFIFIKVLNTMALNISLLNLMGMAIDHFVAIILPLHSNRLMSRGRTTILIVSLWIIAALCGFSDFFSVIAERQYLKKFNFCELTYLTSYQDEYTVFAIALLCFICMVFIYIRIYMKIHRRRNSSFRFHGDHRLNRAENMKQTKKALVTTLIILGTFIFCWLPMCLFQVIMIIQVQYGYITEKWIPILQEADKYLYDLLLLNCILDPLIYAIRMPEVRCGYRKMGWRLARCCRKGDGSDYQSSIYGSLVERKTSVRILEHLGSDRRTDKGLTKTRSEGTCKKKDNQVYEVATEV